MATPRKVRLFLDSNVFTGGLVAPWGLDKAVLSICSAKICRLVLAEAVRNEVEDTLLHRAGRVGHSEGDQMIEEYRELLRLTKPEMVPYPTQQSIIANRHLIRHEADVPVLLSAMASRPDWLLTNNIKHFTAEVAERSGLRIATPAAFFRTLTSLLH